MKDLKQSAQAVQRALDSAGLSCEVRELPDSTRTAQEAADAVGRPLARIAKSIVFEASESGRPVLAAVSPELGRYEYDAILEALAAPGNVVVSEVRPKDTEPAAYAERLVSQMRGLLESGVSPGRITVVGASKGGIIAMLASTALPVPGVGYVIMGSCNEWVQENLEIDLHGDALSIYEASDGIAGTCATVFAESAEPGRHGEVRLETGLGHGFLYRASSEWVDPELSWAAERTVLPGS